MKVSTLILVASCLILYAYALRHRAYVLELWNGLKDSSWRGEYLSPHTRPSPEPRGPRDQWERASGAGASAQPSLNKSLHDMHDINTCSRAVTPPNGHVKGRQCRARVATIPPTHLNRGVVAGNDAGGPNG